MSEALYAACAAGIEDKLFWVPLLPSDEVRLVVDFGAGRTPVAMAAREAGFAPRAEVVLVDNRPGALSDFDTSDWAERGVHVRQEGHLPSYLGEKARQACSVLVASSVLHEQRHPGAVAEELFGAGFTFVVVRDFCRHDGRAPAKQAESDDTWGRVLEGAVSNATRGHLARQPPENDYELVEAALKTRWARGTDRERELGEDYFSLSADALATAAKQHGYFPVHRAHRTPGPVIEILAEFGVRPTVPTHVEAVYYKPTKR